MTDYKALTYVNLSDDNVKEPGDIVTGKELEEAGQTEEDIANLVEAGAISSDMDAPLHEDHLGAEIAANEEADVNVAADDEGSIKEEG